ncbi:MAG: sugar ABC transporter permease [Spirochaetales bacterium]|uniref:Sugar ABC transporter permease n=1 Tax=Candidatus Thalassospirochaeta sargassi TaxID=3119039 RepID=A0AAJ1MLE4_9SPIO|nr:sugar ABC transporter permease [Spirochaetales bacterium]
MVLNQRNNITAFKFILPALLAMLFVHVIPILTGMFISFLDLDIKTLTQWLSAPFVGLRNYFDIFNSGMDVGRVFMRSLWNVVLYGLLTIPIGYVIALAVALLLNNKFPGRTIVRGLVLLPYITPDSVMYNVWRFIFQARIGLVNKLLLQIGLIQEPLIWLVGDRAMASVVMASVWKGWPFTCLILLSGLQGISAELYEAAEIDGASWWKKFRSITWPMLWPVTRTSLIMSCIWNFHAFNQFYVMLGGDTSSSVAVPSLVILREAFTNLHYGLGSAMAVIMLLVVLLFTGFSILSRKEELH